MATFSSAARSPVAGSLGRTLLPGILQRREAANTRRDEQMQKMAQQRRRNELSQGLLGLENIDQKTVTDWAKANSVTAAELKELKPILDQRKKPPKDEKFSPVQKDEFGRQFQTSPKGERKYLPTVEGEKTDPLYGPVETDEAGRQFQLNPKGKREYLPEIKDPNEGKYSEVMTDQYGREYQLGPKQKRHYLPSTSTGQGEVNKVAPWYQTMINENTRFYASGNLEPTRVQQSNIDRANTRTENLVNQLAHKYGKSQGEVYPIAQSIIRKERNMTREVVNTLPPADPGFRGNQQESTLMARDMLNNQVPNHIIGEALTTKGWTNEQVTEIMDVANSLVAPETVGIDMNKLRKRVPNEGQSIIVDGARWTRRGKYLQNAQGEKVAIDGR
jgi:hypothetical protein